MRATFCSSPRLKRVRKIKVTLVNKEVTELGCSECGWTLTIPHRSELEFVEEQEAARLYTAHSCLDFPTKEINSKVS